MAFIRRPRIRLNLRHGKAAEADAPFFENGPPPRRARILTTPVISEAEEAESLAKWERAKRRQQPRSGLAAPDLTALAFYAAALMALSAAERLGRQGPEDQTAVLLPDEGVDGGTGSDAVQQASVGDSAGGFGMPHLLAAYLLGGGYSHEGTGAAVSGPFRNALGSSTLPLEPLGRTEAKARQDAAGAPTVIAMGDGMIAAPRETRPTVDDGATQLLATLPSAEGPARGEAGAAPAQSAAREQRATEAPAEARPATPGLEARAAEPERVATSPATAETRVAMADATAMARAQMPERPGSLDAAKSPPQTDPAATEPAQWSPVEREATRLPERVTPAATETSKAPVWEQPVAKAPDPEPVVTVSLPTQRWEAEKQAPERASESNGNSAADQGSSKGGAETGRAGNQGPGSLGQEKAPELAIDPSRPAEPDRSATPAADSQSGKTAGKEQIEVTAPGSSGPGKDGTPAGSVADGLPSPGKPTLPLPSVDIAIGGPVTPATPNGNAGVVPPGLPVADLPITVPGNVAKPGIVPPGTNGKPTLPVDVAIGAPVLTDPPAGGAAPAAGKTSPAAGGTPPAAPGQPAGGLPTAPPAEVATPGKAVPGTGGSPTPADVAAGGPPAGDASPGKAPPHAGNTPTPPADVAAGGPPAGDAVPGKAPPHAGNTPTPPADVAAGGPPAGDAAPGKAPPHAGNTPTPPADVAAGGPPAGDAAPGNAPAARGHQTAENPAPPSVEQASPVASEPGKDSASTPPTEVAAAEPPARGTKAEPPGQAMAEQASPKPHHGNDAPPVQEAKGPAKQAPAVTSVEETAAALEAALSRGPRKNASDTQPDSFTDFRSEPVLVASQPLDRAAEMPDMAGPLAEAMLLELTLPETAHRHGFASDAVL